MARPPSMKKVRAVYDAVLPAWRRRKGVVRVEIGLKTSRDAAGRERSGVERMTKEQFANKDVDHLVVAIIVYVEEKLAPGDLRANQLFPKEVDGVPVDVQTRPTTRLTSQAPANPPPGGGMPTANPLLGGVRIARQDNLADFGTLTLCVVDAGDQGGAVQYLTCGHVAFANAADHPVMVQPPANLPAAAFGQSATNGITSGAFVDAGTILATPPRVGARRSLLDNGHPLAIAGAGTPKVKDVVRFCGAVTTQGLDGVVSNPNTSLEFSYPGFGDKTWIGLFTIASADNQAAQWGDSGAAVYRVGAGGKVEVLGMVLGFAVNEITGLKATVAQPFLGPVGSFKRLGVTL